MNYHKKYETISVDVSVCCCCCCVMFLFFMCYCGCTMAIQHRSLEDHYTTEVFTYSIMHRYLGRLMGCIGVACIYGQLAGRGVMVGCHLVQSLVLFSTPCSASLCHWHWDLLVSHHACTVAMTPLHFFFKCLQFFSLSNIHYNIKY